MSKLKVAVFSGPNTAVIPPDEMTYGGIEREAYWYVDAFATAGMDVIMIAPADSRPPANVATASLWQQHSFQSNSRLEPVNVIDAQTYRLDLARHLASVIEQHRPDAILLLGPRLSDLAALDEYVPWALERTIVCLCNGPELYGDEMIEFLEAHSELKITALTEMHKRSFPTLHNRIEVNRDGIKVDDYPWSSDPSEARKSSSSGLIRNSGRKLVSQIDTTSSSKGQLLSLRMFHKAQLHQQGYNFLLGGALGSAIPNADPDSKYADQIRYRAALHEYIESNELEDHVYDVGLLNGAQVAEVYRCSEFVLAPHRMDHGSIWPSAGQTAEAYGQAMAIALASGAPVLSSNMIDSGRTRPGATGYVFDSLESGIELTKQLASDVAAGRIDRASIRRFAESNDSIESAVQKYLASFVRIAHDHTPISVVLTGDDGAALPIAVALRSVIESASPKTRRRLALYVVHEMTEDSRRRISDSCDDVFVTFVAGEGLTKVLPDGQARFSYLNNAAWLRVFMGELLPADVSKVLYLDSDTLTRDDIGELFDTDLCGKPLGAVVDYRPDFKTVGWTEINGQKFSGDEPYFNSGVLLCDLDQWRNMSVSKCIVDLMSAIGSVPNFMDQDALNVTFAQTGWTEIGEEWNNRLFARLVRKGETDTQAIESALKAAAILHFATPYKPWRDNFPDGIGRDVYRSIQTLTAFADEPLQHYEASGWRDGVYVEE